jgi:hypothetical protein
MWEDRAVASRRVPLRICDLEEWDGRVQDDATSLPHILAPTLPSLARKCRRKSSLATNKSERRQHRRQQFEKSTNLSVRNLSGRNS